MSMTGPAPPRARRRCGGSGTLATLAESLAGTRAQAALRALRDAHPSVRVSNAPFGVARWAKDQLVVGLDDVHRALEARLDQELEPLTADELVGVGALVGEVERHRALGAMEPNGCLGVEPARR